MTIDYDRLRALRDEATPGPWLCEKEENEYEVYVGTADFGVITEAVNETDGHLIALAPDMARELLALRDEIERTRDRITDEIERTPAELQSARITLHTERVHMLALCNHLLDGDNE